MDYKEKYEQALKRAQKELQTCGSADCDAAKQIFRLFPELKEDEDELEWLKQFIQEEAYILSMDIRDDEDSFRLKKLQKSLEWLEKQGEQKSADEVLKIRQEVYQSGYNDGYKHGIEDVKQGEQEPIEWKDSDEKYLFWALLSIQKDIAASEINGVNTKDLNDCVKWLYSLKQRIGR